MRIRSHLNNLIQGLRAEDVLAHSYRNYHAVGMHYVNLLRTPLLTIKLYVLRPGEWQPNAEGLVVNPHDHRYSFETCVLSGEMSNLTYRQAVAGSNWHEWEYHTPLLPGDERSRYVGPVGLEVTDAGRSVPATGMRSTFLCPLLHDPRRPALQTLRGQAGQETTGRVRGGLRR